MWVNCTEACANHPAGPQDRAQHLSSTVGPSLLLEQQQRGRGLEQEESTIKTAGLVRVLGLQDPSAAWFRGLESQGGGHVCMLLRPALVDMSRTQRAYPPAHRSWHSIHARSAASQDHHSAVRGLQGNASAGGRQPAGAAASRGHVRRQHCAQSALLS